MKTVLNYKSIVWIACFLMLSNTNLKAQDFNECYEIDEKLYFISSNVYNSKIVSSQPKFCSWSVFYDSLSIIDDDLLKSLSKIDNNFESKRLYIRVKVSNLGDILDIKILNNPDLSNELLIIIKTFLQSKTFWTPAFTLKDDIKYSIEDEFTLVLFGRDRK